VDGYMRTWYRISVEVYDLDEWGEWVGARHWRRVDAAAVVADKANGEGTGGIGR
jgi:hypothetical protein